MSWLQATFCWFFLTTFFDWFSTFFSCWGFIFLFLDFLFFCNLTTFMGSFVAFTWSESLNFWNFFVPIFCFYDVFLCLRNFSTRGQKVWGYPFFIFNFMNYKMWLLKCQAMITKMQKTIDQPTVNTKEYPSLGNNWE